MLNKMQAIGRISKDLEVKYMQSGEAVTDFNIAMSEKYTDKQGNKQEKTEWLKVVVYGKRAETCAQYIGKGSLVYVEGKLTTRKWQDKNGVDRYTTEVIASDIKFLDKREQGSAPQGEQSNTQDNYNQQFQKDYDSGMPF